MTTQPQVIERAPQPYIGLRQTVTMTTFGTLADRFPEMFEWLAEHGREPAGAPFFRYLVIDMDRELLVEAGIPVAEPIAEEPAGDLLAAELPGGRYVTAAHHGHPDALVDATAALLAWADEQGLTWDCHHTSDGEAWECRLEVYRSNPLEVPIDEWDVDLLFKLAD